MRRLLLFAKCPRLGRVKTRLMPRLSPEQALALYRAFLSDQVRFLRSLDDVAEVEVWLDGPWRPGPGEEPSFGGLRVREQSAGDLGERLLRAFEQCSNDGASATVVIAADSPTLPARHVVQAFETLEGGRAAVAAPAEDGGYVLIGLRRPIATLFRDVPWGGPEVLPVTLERARQAGIRLALLDPWYDVDDAAGLERLARDLADSGEERAPETTRRVAALLAG